jgi:chromate reductase
MPNPTLLTISGSLRKGSFNRMLLVEAAMAFGPATVHEADLNLPLYDGDLEAAKGIPANVQTLAHQISSADAIVVSSPEYNKGISGVLKNALDWISRVEGIAFKDKPTIVIAAAAGRTGGEAAYIMTQSCLTQLQAHLLPGPAVLLAGAMNEFDAGGRLTNAQYMQTLTTRMQALRGSTRQ